MDLWSDRVCPGGSLEVGLDAGRGGKIRQGHQMCGPGLKQVGWGAGLNESEDLTGLRPWRRTWQGSWLDVMQKDLRVAGNVFFFNGKLPFSSTPQRLNLVVCLFVFFFDVFRDSKFQV